MSDWTSNSKPPHPPVSMEDLLSALDGIRPPNPAEVPETIHVCQQTLDVLEALLPKSKMSGTNALAFVRLGIALEVDDSIPRTHFEVEYADGHRERKSFVPPPRGAS